MPEYFRVTQAFAYGNAVAPAGEVWSDDNPAYKGREQFFEPVGVAAARSTSTATETASAEPGSVRGRSKPPAKKAAPVKKADEKADEKTDESKDK